MTDTDRTKLMDEALKLARTAMRLGEAPIAAVVARGGQVIGWGWNEFVAKRDLTMHGEIAAFRDAAGRYPMECEDLQLICTLEPCVMCLGASILCGVKEIVYALPAPTDGGARRVKKPDSPDAQFPNIIGGFHEAESRKLFQEWLDHHPEEDAQRAYISQLLASTKASR